MEAALIGDSILYCGDCYGMLPLPHDYDVMITDPPYELQAEGGGIGSARKYMRDIGAEGLGGGL